MSDGRSPLVVALPALIDAQPDAAILFAADDGVLECNALARTLFALDTRLPLERQQAADVLGTLHGEILAAMERARACGRGQRFVAHDARRSTALDRWFDVQVVPLPDRMMLVTAADVTAREAGQEQLRREARQHAVLLTLVPAAVRVVDLSGGLTMVSPGVGAPGAALEPTTLRELWERDAPSDPATGTPVPYLETPGLRALSGETVRGSVMYVSREPDGQRRLIEAWASPIRDETDLIAGALLFDVVVDSLSSGPAGESAASSELRQQRMAAMSQLAAGLMHDINNVLSPIVAAAFLLHHHAESPALVREYADRVAESAGSMSTLAARLGRFIRQQPERMHDDGLIDLRVLANEVLESIQIDGVLAASGREITMSYHLETVAPIHGVAGDMREAVRHLVENAIEAMRHGGTLTVRTFGDGDDVCLSLQDTGVGMPLAVGQRAFDPWFSTKGSGRKGLGLSEVYGVVRRHGGETQLVSARGEGTTVTIRLPRAEFVT